MINFEKSELDSDSEITYIFSVLTSDIHTAHPAYDTDSNDSADAYYLNVLLKTSRTDIICEYCNASDFTSTPVLYKSDGHYGIHHCLGHIDPSAQLFILQTILSL